MVICTSSLTFFHLNFGSNVVPVVYSWIYQFFSFFSCVTSCIQTGKVVNAVGPFPCGKWPDVNILKKHVLPLLDDNEMIEAGKEFFAKSEKVAKRNVAAQHETINGRLVLQWRSLYYMFCHSHHEHTYFFFTAVIINNLNYQKYGPMFAK